LSQSSNNDLLASLVDPDLFYNNAPVGYLSILEDGTIVRLNQTLLTWLGYKEEEILYNKNFTDLLSKGGCIHYEMFFRPMIKVNGTVKELNYEIIRKDGSSLPALISANAIYDEQGNLKAMTIAVTDITQRNLYEKELLKAKEIAESEKERFERLAETSPQMIWTVNAEGRLTYFNKKIKEYFNFKERSVETKTIFNHVHPLDKIKLLKKWLEANNEGSGFIIALRLLDRDSNYQWFKVNVINSKKDFNEFKWFGTCSSIDEHVKALKRKDDFINMASHELKTPVTILQSYLQLMELYPIPGEVREFVGKSISTLRKFQFLISSLLNVSVINSGKLTLNPSIFSLNNLLEFTIEQLRHTTSTHQLVTELDSQQIMVKADMERIGQVIMNLVSNAIKYSPNADSVLITLNLNKDNSKAQIRIRDYGVGIPGEDIDKIFERYYRVEGIKSQPGLGLGLYISQSILLSHGSKFLVESELGKGTSFCFALPVVQSN